MYEWRTGTASPSTASPTGVPASARGSFPSVGASDSASGEDTCGCVPECGSRARGSGGVGVGRRVARVVLYSGSAALFVYALHSEPPRAAVVRALKRLGTLPPDFTDFAGRAKYLTFLNSVCELLLLDEEFPALYSLFFLHCLLLHCYHVYYEMNTDLFCRKFGHFILCASILLFSK